MLGVSNNLNNTGFDLSDLSQYGGINRGGIGFGGFGNFGSLVRGMQTTNSGGANINTDYGKKLKLNLAYYYTRTYTEYFTLNNRQQFLNNTGLAHYNDTTLTTSDQSNSSTTLNKHNISASVRVKPNDATQLYYYPTLSISTNQSLASNTSNSFSNYVPAINKAGGNSTSVYSNLQFQQSLNYNHRFGKNGRSIDVQHSFKYSPGQNTSYNNSTLTSFTSFPSYTLKRYADGESKGIDANVTFSYRSPLTKNIIFSLGVSSGYNRQLDKTATFDYDASTGGYDLVLPDQSYNLTRINWAQSINPGFNFTLPKNITLNVGLSAQYQQITNVFNRNIDNINRNYFNLLPNVQLSKGNVSFDYSTGMELPYIGDMIPYSVIFSPLYSVMGNPGLKPSQHQNFNLSYNTYVGKSQVRVSLKSGISIDRDAIIRRRTLNDQLAETSMPINRNGRYNFTNEVQFNKRFKKTKVMKVFSTTTTLMVGKRHDFFELNHTEGYQDTYYANFSQRFSVNWKDLITLDPSYGLNQSFVTYNGIDFGNRAYTTQRFDTPFHIYWPKRIVTEGNFAYSYNGIVSPGFKKSINLLSLSISRMFLKKDRGQIKLACYDILNQSVASTRVINENMINDTQSLILKRYFLLTLQFNFRKTVTN